MNLIIVESPHKAKTIEKFLGSNYKVDASKGHVRDLPEKTMGVDISKGTFEPYYEISPKRKQEIQRLQEKAKKAEKVYLATDPDREGEAISWHLAEVLKLDKDKYSRIEFNEITEKAVKQALENPREIDKNLVDAQQARRVLDRIVGYTISPAASTRLNESLSAGRVQSVALELVVDREREIKAFVPKEYWNVKANLKTSDGTQFKALLSEYNEKKYKPSSKEETEEVVAKLNAAPFTVKGIKKSVTKTHAPAPFITSTLQQDGSSKLGLTAPQVMQLAQQLYEGVETPNGHLALITYMRTDSVRISKEAQNSALSYIKSTYGNEYAPSKPNVYKSKKSAQDAHEAIRPIDVLKTPESVKNILSKDQFRLYKIIYERFIASQMSEAKYNSVQLDVDALGYVFKASGKTLLFKGFTAVYEEFKQADSDEEENVPLLPDLKEGEKLELINCLTEQKFTKPPQRYTEATLIKTMEDKGIGRPSTYASIMQKLSDKKREYLKKEGKYLVPNDISYQLIDFLVKYFPDIMSITFTARMETALDDIGDGGRDWHKLIADFYRPFSKQVNNSKITDVLCEKCGSPMFINSGRWGNYYACTNYPNCNNIKPVNEKVNVPTDQICEKCGGVMLEREGKYGKFLACSNYPTCNNKRSLNEKRSEKKCPNCGDYLVEKTGRYGKYYACAKCNHTESEAVNMGVCPTCGKPTKKMTSRGGKTFYGCTSYPECKFMSWDLPTGETCPKCGQYLVEINGEVKCSNKKCDYKKEK